MINPWSLSLAFSQLGNTFETCHWLVPNANKDDCQGCFNFVSLLLAVVNLFINISEPILFRIPSPVPNIPVRSLCTLPLVCAGSCNHVIWPSKDGFRKEVQAGLASGMLVCISNSTLLRDHSGLNNNCCWPMFLITYGPPKQIKPTSWFGQWPKDQ